MSLTILVPEDRKKLIQGIQALKWQIENETDLKSKEIFTETLKLYEIKLVEIDYFLERNGVVS